MGLHDQSVFRVPPHRYEKKQRWLQQRAAFSGWALQLFVAGLTGFVNEAGEEVVVVNVMGNIGPRALGRLLANLANVDLEEIMAKVEQ